MDIELYPMGLAPGRELSTINYPHQIVFAMEWVRACVRGVLGMSVSDVTDDGDTSRDDD